MAITNLQQIVYTRYVVRILLDFCITMKLENLLEFLICKEKKTIIDLKRRQ